MKSPPRSQDNEHDDVDKHFNDDNGDDDDDQSRGGRNERGRKQQGWLLPGTVRQHNNLVCGGVNGVMANGEDLIFAGDLNVDLERTVRRWLDEEIAVAVAMVGLEDISAHFLPRLRAWNWYQRPWAVVKQGRLMRSWMDYILGSNNQIYQDMAVQDPRHNSGPLHGHGVSAFHLPEGSVILPCA